MKWKLEENQYKVGMLLKRKESEEPCYELIDFPLIRRLNQKHYKVVTGEEQGNVYPVYDPYLPTNSKYEIKDNPEVFITQLFAYDPRVDIEKGLEFAREILIGSEMKYDTMTHRVHVQIPQSKEYKFDEDGLLILPIDYEKGLHNVEDEEISYIELYKEMRKKR